MISAGYSSGKRTAAEKKVIEQEVRKINEFGGGAELSMGSRVHLQLCSPELSFAM